MNSDGRKKFDVFLREFINTGENKPKSIKLSKVKRKISLNFQLIFSQSILFIKRITYFLSVVLAMTSFSRKKPAVIGKIGPK